MEAKSTKVQDNEKVFPCHWNDKYSRESIFSDSDEEKIEPKYLPKEIDTKYFQEIEIGQD